MRWFRGFRDSEYDNDKETDKEKDVEAGENDSAKAEDDERARETEYIDQKIQEEKETSWFERLKKGLLKSRENIVGQISSLLSIRKIDEELWDDIEAILIQADIGIQSTMRIIDSLKDRVAMQKINESEQVIELLKEELVDILRFESPQTLHDTAARRVILVVGVNGTGKTTTIAKLARRYVNAGKSVLLAAADTFRAAAIEQLDIWAKRLNVDIVKHERGSDPAAVVYDAIHAANARKTDILLIDTAGRLHTYVNLMEELKKIKRIADREKGNAELETLLVIDATTGQNGIAQARLFDEALKVDGIILTKLDGTAKGGIVLAIQDELNIPVRYVGVGEGMEDLHEFNPKEFVEALVG